MFVVQRGNSPTSQERDCAIASHQIHATWPIPLTSPTSTSPRRRGTSSQMCRVWTTDQMEQISSEKLFLSLVDGDQRANLELKFFGSASDGCFADAEPRKVSVWVVSGRSLILLPFRERLCCRQLALLMRCLIWCR